MYENDPEFFPVTFDASLHEGPISNALFNDSDTESAVIVDRDDIVAFVFDKAKAEQMAARLNLGRVAYETMKEIINAADGTDPYSNRELIEILSPVLHEMYGAGIRGQGEE